MMYGKQNREGILKIRNVINVWVNTQNWMGRSFNADMEIFEAFPMHYCASEVKKMVNCKLKCSFYFVWNIERF